MSSRAVRSALRYVGLSAEPDQLREPFSVGLVGALIGMGLAVLLALPWWASVLSVAAGSLVIDGAWRVWRHRRAGRPDA
jgi:hypothetical protein